MPFCQAEYFFDIFRQPSPVHIADITDIEGVFYPVAKRTVFQCVSGLKRFTGNLVDRVPVCDNLSVCLTAYFRLHLKVHGTPCHRTELFDRPILHGRQISGMKNPHQIPVSFRAADIFPVIADNSGRDLLGFRAFSRAYFIREDLSMVIG